MFAKAPPAVPLQSMDVQAPRRRTRRGCRAARRRQADRAALLRATRFPGAARPPCSRSGVATQRRGAMGSRVDAATRGAAATQGVTTNCWQSASRSAPIDGQLLGQLASPCRREPHSSGQPTPPSPRRAMLACPGIAAQPLPCQPHVRPRPPPKNGLQPPGLNAASARTLASEVCKG